MATSHKSDEEQMSLLPSTSSSEEPPGKPAADSPRYKAIGNSMAVPVMRWIGERIQMVEDSRKPKKKARKRRGK